MLAARFTALVNNVPVHVPLLLVRLGLDFTAASAEIRRIAPAARLSHQLEGKPTLLQPVYAPLSVRRHASCISILIDAVLYLYKVG